MADYKPTILTKAGLKILQKVIQGRLTLNFSKIEVGIGQVESGEAIENLTSLIDSKINVSIKNIKNNEDGSCSVCGSYTNEGMTDSFTLNEIGVFVKDEDDNDVLYAYSTADGHGDFFGAGSTLLQENIEILVYVSTATNITANITHTVKASDVDMGGVDVGTVIIEMQEGIEGIVEDVKEIKESLDGVKFRKLNGVLEHSTDNGVTWLKSGGNDMINFSLPWTEASPEWRDGVSAPKNMYRGSAVLYGTKAYVFGGNISPFNHLQIYDIPTNTWSTGADSPKSTFDSSAVLYGTKVYVFGGTTLPYNYVQIYDILTNTWSTGLDAPKSTYYASSILHETKVYVFGGDPSAPTYVQIYDISTNTWSTGASASQNMNHSSAVLYGTKVYVFGGLNSSCNYVQIYDISTNTWSTGADSQKNIAVCCSMLFGTKAYVFGGSTPPYNYLQIYDIPTNTWSTGADSPKRLDSSSAVLYGSNVYIFCHTINSQNCVQIYDITGYEYADDRGVKYKIGDFEKDDILYASTKLYDQNDNPYNAGVEHILTGNVEIFAYFLVPTKSQHVGWVKKGGAKGIVTSRKTKKQTINVDMELLQ